MLVTLGVKLSARPSPAEYIVKLLLGKRVLLAAKNKLRLILVLTGFLLPSRSGMTSGKNCAPA